MSEGRVFLSVEILDSGSPVATKAIVEKELRHAFGSTLCSVELVDRVEVSRSWIDVPLPGLGLES